MSQTPQAVDDVTVDAIAERAAEAVRHVRRDRAYKGKSDQEKMDAIIAMVKAFFPENLANVEPVIVQAVRIAYRFATGDLRVGRGCC